ncbi:MAG: M48 family metallopeptidase [Clostridia bacterium]|nr:M48 family metallopeptidase [Clostridia bacterium]
MGIKTIRTVSFGGIPIEYTLERKPVKNINLRVRSDKSVYVSANARVPVRYIDDFVRSKGAFIINAQKKTAAAPKSAAAPKKYENGEAFRLLGRTFYLKITEGAKEGVYAEDDRLVVIQKNVSDKKRTERLVKSFKLELCKSVFTKLHKARYPDFQAYTRGLPALRIRDMKSRWGSCIPAKNVITLNSRLIEKSPELIDYVVLHEYCHFVHPNHSAAFHALVARYMPDWKKRRTLLNA